MTQRHLLLFILLAYLLAGCAGTSSREPTEPAVSSPSGAPPTPPAAADTQAPTASHTTTAGRQWRLADTRLVVHVGKAGALARLGHNHVVTGTTLTGRVTEQAGSIVAVVRFPVAQFVVDDPQVRAEFEARDPGRYNSTPSSDDRAGTRRNMLGPKVLDAENFPELQARIEATIVDEASASGQLPAKLLLTVRDQQIRLPITLQWQRPSSSEDHAANPVLWQSRFTVSHAALGLTPFSALGGALRVASELTIELTGRLVATH